MFRIDPRLQKRYLWLGIGVLWWGLIAVLSLVSSPYISMPGYTDKLYHAAGYTVLMGWWLQLFPQPRARTMLAAVFVLFGVAIEVLQSFEPLRHFDVLDMLANTSGVSIAWLLGSFTPFGQLLYRFETRFL